MDSTRVNLITKLGPWMLRGTIFLAPIMCGNPRGDAFGSDASTEALHVLIFLTVLTLGLPNLLAGAWNTRVAGFGTAIFAGWSVLSLLVHSRALTDQTFLFTMLPGTLDVLSQIGICLIAAVAWPNPNLRQDLATSMQVAATAVGLITLSQAGLGTDSTRAVGTFFSPNFTAGYIGVALPFVVADLIGATRLPKRILLCALLGILGAAIVATGSRSGIALAAAGVTLTYLTAFVRDKTRVPIVWVCAGGVALILGAFMMRGTLVARTSGGNQDHSGAFRSQTWSGTRRMITAKPYFGHGPATFPLHYGAFAEVEWTGQAHNSYLQSAAEVGTPAVAGALIIILMAITGQLRHFRRSTGAPVHPLEAAILPAIIVGACRSLLDSEWIVPGNAIPFWMAVGCGLPAAQAAPRTRYTFALPAVVSLLLAAGQLNWPANPEAVSRAGDVLRAAELEPSAKRWFLVGKSLQAKNELPAALSAFRNAAQRDRTSQQVWRGLAEAALQAGDVQTTKTAYQRIIDLEEGIAGQIKAIPEITETHVVYAYKYLAFDKDTPQPKRIQYMQHALDVTTKYLATADIYAMMELGQTSGNTVAQKSAKSKERRQDLRRTAYDMAVKLQEEGVSGQTPAMLNLAFEAYEARFDALIAEQQQAAPTPSSGTLP